MMSILNISLISDEDEFDVDSSHWADQTNPLLWRYLKPTWMSNPSVCFSLRESPPEDYVSFWHTLETTYPEQIKDVIKSIKRRCQRYKLGSTSGFLSLDSWSLSIDNKELLHFEDCDYPHIGLFYHNPSSSSCVECTSKFLLFATIYQRTHESYSLLS
jgi:hypothetical protein